MKKIFGLISGAALLSSCNSVMLSDAQAREDYHVCTAAVAVSSSIRADETKLDGYKYALAVLDIIINEKVDVVRDELESLLTAQLQSVFSAEATKIIVDDIMSAYDSATDSLTTNQGAMTILKNTRSAINSGIILYENPERPVQVISAAYAK